MIKYVEEGVFTGRILLMRPADAKSLGTLSPKPYERWEGNCSVKRSIYTPFIVHYLLLLAMVIFVHQIYAPNLCFKSIYKTTETSNTNMRYLKSLTPSPIVAM